MTPQNPFARLLAEHPVVFFHLVTAFAALLLGIVILARRKGTGSHRALGWAWALAMGSTAVASAFIRDYQLPNLAGYTPIHFFTLYVAVTLPLAIWFARSGRIPAHRRTMQGMFFGACVVAGLFTLLPGRFLGQLVWRQLGVLA